MLRKDHQEHLEKARLECGFKYLRFHGLFQDDMGVYREDKNGHPIYSWQYVDKVYDYILSIGIRPFIVFDFMPEKLASGDTTVFWERANITPPRDFAKWEKLIYETVKHFADRYGYNEVNKWFFEVWNEPNLTYFFEGTMNDYFKLYESSARAVKSVCDTFRVGGPAVSGADSDWIISLINYCDQHQVPIDFISAHSYSLKPGNNLSKEEDSDQCTDYTDNIPVWTPGNPWPQGNQYCDAEGVEKDVSKAYNAVKSSVKPDLNIYFTEWGLTYEYWDPLRDSYHAASYILSRLKSAQGYVKAMSYCEISDVFEEDGPPTRDFHGGFGLVNLQGIRKPSFFAYKFLNSLGDIALECDDSNTFACSDDCGVKVLFWDCGARQNRENKKYYNQDLPSLPSEKIRLSVSGLKPGEYDLSVYVTGYGKNDAYTSYLGMKYNGSLSREQIGLLESKSTGLAVNTSKISIGDSRKDAFEFEVDMCENDVFLVTLEARSTNKSKHE